VALSGGEKEGALLAVPLLVRTEPYGVLALGYGGERAFTDLDVRLAASFGGQVALAIENARLRDEVRQAAAASERSRLARDLHDSVTQSLFAASLKAEAARRRWRPASVEARQNLEDVERLARGALAEMRTLLMEMRPDALAGASLPHLLEMLAAAAEGGSRVRVGVDVQGAAQLPQHVSVTLFRIAQEALQNMTLHSGAEEAWVMLDTTGAEVRLSVRDDGRGFDVATVSSEHLGLRMMRERAEDAGVGVAVESVPGAGTTVRATWRREDVER
jgi:signal transduction histidine kinase